MGSISSTSGCNTKNEVVIEAPISVLVVGCGMRGRMYSNFALEHPELCKIVAIAEPRKNSRGFMVKKHKISDSNVFTDWKEVSSLKRKICDCVFICTQDEDHLEPTLAFAEMGYNILLEKPMGRTEEECKMIVESVRKNGVFLCVCHVLRYSASAQKVKKMLQENKIGRILNIQHIEQIGYYHYAHSFVRGNWSSEAKSNFILLTKSCHDLDLICYYMNSRCRKVSSFGNLTHFQKSSKPKGAGDRCLDCGVEETCPYSAKKLYIDRMCDHWCRPLMKNDEVPDIENVTEALQSGPYGKCVFSSNNDVCDTQVVNLEFENGATASFSLVATTMDYCERRYTIFGSLGEIEIYKHVITRKDFLTNTITKIDVSDLFTEKVKESKMSMHGYADYFLMKQFFEAILEGDPSRIFSDEVSTLESHRLCFLAEKARKENKVIELAL